LGIAEIVERSQEKEKIIGGEMYKPAKLYPKKY
jgi:hypothetical protein